MQPMHDMRSRRHLAAAAFAALIALAVFWPAPVVALNDACCGARLPVDGLSFLGREAPSWDVAFWCIAGLFLITTLQSFHFSWRAFAAPAVMVRNAVPAGLRRVPLTMSLLAGAAAVALTWRFLDSPVTGWAEAVASPRVEDVIRIFNRLGGGMNPVLIVLFFLIVGVISAHEAWVRYGVAMAMAGAGAGIAGQLIKYAAGRTRPELWLGPSTRAQAGATSFPSGHTVGAFALAGVLLFASRSVTARTVALLLAVAVGLSRILALRHWASDVLASALLGVLAAYLAVKAIQVRSNTGEPASGP
jgi:membrane-associated phospholipid phosphatase